MNFSVKSVLKRRRNYLILFLFIFRTRCIYKSSYTSPSHPPKYTLRGEPHRFAKKICVIWPNRSHLRIRRKNLRHLRHLRDPFISPARIGLRKNICVNQWNLWDFDDTPRPHRPQKKIQKNNFIFKDPHLFNPKYIEISSSWEGKKHSLLTMASWFLREKKLSSPRIRMLYDKKFYSEK